FGLVRSGSAARHARLPPGSRPSLLPGFLLAQIRRMPAGTARPQAIPPARPRLGICAVLRGMLAAGPADRAPRPRRSDVGVGSVRGMARNARADLSAGARRGTDECRAS